MELFISDIVARAAASYSIALRDLPRTYANDNVTEMRRKLSEFFVQQANIFRKLLILVRWVTKQDRWQICEDALKQINQQKRLVTSIPDSLYFIHQSQVKTRLPPFNIQLSASILGSQQYPFIPSIVKNIGQTLPGSVKLNKKESIQLVLLAENELRTSLGVCEVPKCAGLQVEIKM
ncbi:MAG: hypothetical protein EZS28_013632 [Streblomastix strix]|uniref:Mediator of RNA polymerase II transcription subunit 14 n=1 Tax=Streblomastix strix TaxID=222440 RepID=A0A5J4W7C3_9EUKA|nr:MAG: hypothetical protein EZS28_013632 [Streblomastix strix]